MKIAILPGDGIGPEIVREARKVLDALRRDGLPIETEEAPIGGAGYDAAGHPLPRPTLALAQAADAVLLGAVGGPKYDTLPREMRPGAGHPRHPQGARHSSRTCGPALLYPELAAASTLKPDVVAGLDLMIVRELTGDIYFGEPRGRRTNAAGEREGFDTMRYAESEIARIARVGFETARKRQRRLTSVDKANVLDTSMLWREVVTEVAQDYPDVALSHMYVDNAAMQLVRAPKSSTSSSPATCSATSCPTRRRCSPARSACCRRRRSMRTARGCTSRSTARRRTSRARTGRIRWRRSCRSR